MEILKKLGNASFWAEMWELSKTATDQVEAREPLDHVEIWEKRSEQFTSSVSGERGEKRTEEVLRWIENQGINLDGLTVLDIGAGPGTFSCAFAKKTGRVTALEPTMGMSGVIRERKKAEQLHNLEVVQMPWETVDIEEMGWKGAFDLVFISMCPGVQSVDLFEKAMSCAKKYLYFSGWAGRRESEAFCELWKELYGNEAPTFQSDIIYLMNWLYASGFDLTFDVKLDSRIQVFTEKEGAEELIARLSFQGRDIEALSEKVSAFVSKRSQKGQFKTKAVSRSGRILLRL
jgi:SAM-dependent methyltransferase